jgi:hypothetical protein
MKLDVTSSGEMEYSINGNTIKKSKYNSHYDGNELKISGSDNGKQFYEKLSNNDIQDILSLPLSNLSLEERLKRDYKNGNDNNIQKRTKKQRTKKQRTNKQRTKKTRKQ